MCIIFFCDFPGLSVISRQLLNGNQVECPKIKCLNQEHLKINFSKTPCLIKVKPIKHSRHLAYWEITIAIAKMIREGNGNDLETKLIILFSSD